MKIGIIGGGITGLATAYYLSKKGHDIILFEKNLFGGLAGSFKINDVYLEKYYHHFFIGDTDLINLLKELKLENKIIFKETKMAFFFKKRIYPFNTAIDLLKFKPLNIFDRLKLGLFILYCKNTKNWKKLDKISVKEWIVKNFGNNMFNIVWKPLLKVKFGDKFNQISAAWLWGRIHPRANSRSGGKEKLSYLIGGTSILIKKLIKEILKSKGKLKKESITLIRKEKEKVRVKTTKRSYLFDKVIVTTALPIFKDIAKGLPDSYIKGLEEIEYQSVVCLILKLKKPLSDIYWLNITDNDILFGGIIEHTNFITKKYYNSHIVYLFNYIPKIHKIYNLSNKKLFSLYLQNIKKIFPYFEKELVKSYFIFRDEYATPVYKKNYLKNILPYKTPIDNVYIANISQIYPDDRNMNNSIRIAKKVSKIVSLK